MKPEETPTVAYFHKSIIRNPIFGLPGEIRWIEISNGNGILEESRPHIVEALRKKAKAGAGGVTEITKETFDEKKTQQPTPRRSGTLDRKFDRLRVANPPKGFLRPPQGQPDAEAAGAAGKPALAEDIQAPTRPTVGKIPPEAIPSTPEP